MYYPYVLSLSIIEIPLLLCYWHQNNLIWRRTNERSVNLDEVFSRRRRPHFS